MREYYFDISEYEGFGHKFIFPTCHINNGDSKVVVTYLSKDILKGEMYNTALEVVKGIRESKSPIHPFQLSYLVDLLETKDFDNNPSIMRKFLDYRWTWMQHRNKEEPFYFREFTMFNESVLVLTYPILNDLTEILEESREIFLASKKQWSKYKTWYFRNKAIFMNSYRHTARKIRLAAMDKNSNIA